MGASRRGRRARVARADLGRADLERGDLQRADLERAGALASLASALGYGANEAPTPALTSALTHRSYVNELPPARRAANPDNQRLEFLGDAVVGLVVARHLMALEGGASEGQLSAKRARLINADALARCADSLGLEPLLRCGRGELKMGPHARTARLADAFEAVAGALFEDLGFERADQWVWGALSPVYEALGDEVASAKSRLQELTITRYKLMPRYEPLEPQVSPEGEPLVGVAVWLGEERLASSYASRRKLAEEGAALDALSTLSRREPQNH